MKRKLSMILALLLVCVLTVTAAPLSAVAEGNEPIVFDFFVESWSWPLGDGIFTDTQPALKWLYDQTGVELNFITYDGDKFAVYAAGGQLPDIVNTTSTGTFEKLLNSEQMLPLNDLLEKYGSTITSKIPNAIAMWQKKYDMEEIYAVPVRPAYPSSVPGTRGGVAFRLRYDIWKAIGSPEYHTEDELIAVLKQMQDYQRAQTGRDDIWGYGAGLDGFTIQPILISKGYSTLGTGWELPGVVDPATLEFIPSITDENSPFWEAVAFVNKAWRAGILDPESVLFSSAEQNERIEDGRYLSAHNWSTMPKADFCGEEALFAALPFGPFMTISELYGKIFPAGYPGIGISKNCKDPERAMQLIDFLASDDCLHTFWNGEKGVYWDYDENGAPVLVGELKAAFEESKDAGNALLDPWNLGGKGASWWLLGLDVPNSHGQKIALSDTKEFMAKYLKTADKIYADDFGYAYPGEVYDKWYQDGLISTLTVDAASILALMGPLSEDTKIISDETMAYFEANYAPLFLAESDAEFEAAKTKMISEMKNRGYDTVYEEYLQLFDEAKAK